MTTEMTCLASGGGTLVMSASAITFTTNTYTFTDDYDMVIVTLESGGGDYSTVPKVNGTQATERYYNSTPAASVYISQAVFYDVKKNDVLSCSSGTWPTIINFISVN